MVHNFANWDWNPVALSSAASLVDQCCQVDTNVSYEIAEKDGFCQISFQMLTSCLRPAKIVRD